MGNVDLPEEIEAAVRMGAQGVGLLRTEFLLTGRATLPTETEQTDYFRRVAAAFHGHTVIIRSYDLGGDKFPVAFKAPLEANPFLGWRSIRVCLDEPEVFRPQIRALLRAAVDRDIQLMLPLVTLVEEVEETRDIVLEEGEALRKAGIPAAASLPVGVMIETPAAALIADRLAEVSAFFSIGTNDLTQYTLAVDRGNARLADRFTPHHPSVVRQLHQVLEVGRAAGIPVSVCGEMASESLSAVLLLGLGYDPAQRLSAGAAPGQVGGPHRARVRGRARRRIGPRRRQRERGLRDPPQRRRRVHRRPAARPPLGVARAGTGGYLATRQDVVITVLNLLFSRGNRD